MPSPFDIANVFKTEESPFAIAIKQLVVEKNPNLINKSILSKDELNLIWDIGFALSLISQTQEEWTKQ